MEKTTFNISEVARLTGKARSTITNHIKSSKLSCNLDADGNKMIDASEIIRVYPNQLELSDDGKLKPKTKRIEKESTSDNSGGSQFQKMWELERDERDRERKQLEKTIEHLRGDLERSQERESRGTQLLENQTKLLENHSEGSVLWKQQMEDRLTEQESETKKFRRALERKQQALEDERNKAWWQRLGR